MSRQATHVLHRFPGGVHPPQHKLESNQTPIRSLPLPPLLTLPLRQSLGNAAKPLVAIGDIVSKGQRLAAADGNLSSAVHAPTSGRIVAIAAAPIAHASGLSEQCIQLQPDGEERWGERTPLDWRQADAATVRDFLCDHGVVGLGGAVFPTQLKLGRQGLATLVLNGAECEPYISCDDRLMREHAADIVAGAVILQHLLAAKQTLIGVEDNKPEAIAALRAALAQHQDAAAIAVVAVPTIYPGGGAKQLIKVLTGVEVPGGVRATDYGVQCFNVATARAVYRALQFGEPLLSRIVTVAGAVVRPGNVEALIGTPIDWLLAQAGLQPDADGAILGGPMMGLRLPNLAVPVSKSCNCLIATSPALFPPPPPPQPCIRCGDCARACPVALQPMDLFWFAKSKNLGKAQEWRLFDCIECGACAYVCPSSIPLVDYYRFAKAEIWDAERQRKAANLARQRHEYRQFRLERDKQEKAERLAAKAAVKIDAATASPDPADAVRAAKIQAAMARAAARQTPAAPETALAPPAAAVDKQTIIRAAMERAAAQKTAQAAPPKPEEPQP